MILSVPVHQKTIVSVMGGVTTGLVMGFLLYQSFTPEWDIFNVYACNVQYGVPPCTNTNLISGVGGPCDTAYSCWVDDGSPDCMTVPMTQMCQTGLACYGGTCTDSCIVPSGVGSCEGLVITLSGEGGPCETILASCYEPNSPAGSDCTMVPIMTSCETGLTCASGTCYSSCIPPDGVPSCSGVASALSGEGGSCGGMIGNCYEPAGPAGSQCTTVPIMQECESGLSCDNGTCTDLTPPTPSSASSSSPC